ncbi:hypothetical protein EUTSA_v10022317mg [Eutrema salsugineum]|uniref:Pectinesterase inhibitor domain-containing protein n=1 Tax=Eutrema salsugineum TaxID=72664 RepID=V4M088_EUTSA|nr:cell wall / vacuolar inhibitor of fructosidase 1 [Eutrema salsugineum]ESQ48212.1 hypothetical protein EUTSA_v10022317mg [Eutrema salsugineum]
MNNIMKLLSIVSVCIKIQIALSQPNQPTPGPNSVRELCKLNIYPSLCITTLNHDPRSKNANGHGLALISVDATSKKMRQMLKYLISVRKNIKNRQDSTRYDTCIKAYDTAVHKFLPAELADLKLKRFSQAMSEMKSVVSMPDYCEGQFPETSPLTDRIKAVHDIAGMSADIIRYLYGNY